MSPSRFYNFCDTRLNRVRSKNLAAPAAVKHYMITAEVQNPQPGASCSPLDPFFLKNKECRRARPTVCTAEHQHRTFSTTGRSDYKPALDANTGASLVNVTFVAMICHVPEQEIVPVRLITWSVFTSTLLSSSVLCRPSRFCFNYNI